MIPILGVLKTNLTQLGNLALVPGSWVKDQVSRHSALSRNVEVDSLPKAKEYGTMQLTRSATLGFVPSGQGRSYRPVAIAIRNRWSPCGCSRYTRF